MENLYNLPFYIGDIDCALISVSPYQPADSEIKLYREHHHYYFELHAVQQGQCGFLCDNETVTIDNSVILLLPPQIYHKEVSSSEDCVRMSLSLSLKADIEKCGKESAYFYDAFHKIHKPIIFERTKVLEDSLASISALAGQDRTLFLVQEKLRVAANALLLELFQALKKNTDAENIRKTLPPAPKYMIDNFFARNYMSSNAKNALAEELHISPRQLHRILTDLYGKNYREKLNEIRVRVAAGFLMDTDMSIADIAEKMGYSTPENFATFMKNETGMTPGQIRKNGLPATVDKKDR